MVKRHLIHANNNQIVNSEPKLPTANDIRHGELAVNYAKGNETISLKNTDNEIVAFNIGKSIKSIKVNNVNGTVSNNVASVVISGNNMNVGTYTSVEYPEEFSAATNVSGSQTVAQAFNSVESTISALTKEMIDNEFVTEQGIVSVAQAAGTVDANNNIGYTANTSTNYISGASSLKNADDILDAKVGQIESTVGSISTDLENLPYAGAESGITGGPAAKAVSIPFGVVDSTSVASAFTATIDGITELRDGVCCYLKNGKVTSTTGFTLDINGLGAKPCYTNLDAATRDTTVFNSGYTMLFVYNTTRNTDGCWDIYRGYDSNTLGYNISYYYNHLLAKTNISRYKLTVICDDKHILQVSSGDTTATTKTITTESFDPFGDVMYYSGTAIITANTSPANATMWTQRYNTIDLRYSFNIVSGSTNGLASKSPIYLVLVPQNDGKVKFHTTPIAQALPTTEDGLIYKLIGLAYNSYSIILFQEKPCYYFKDGQIRLWTNQTTVDISGKANKSEMSITPGTGADADKTTIQLKDGLSTTVLTAHQDISGKANKSEMSVTQGTGADADKTTIQLKTGTSATVLTAHQDISGKANKSEMSVTQGTGANADKTTIQLKDGLSATVLTTHQDISGKANKNEMTITPGTGANSGTTTIQLKTGTSTTVLTEHQDISGKADVDHTHLGSAVTIGDYTNVVYPTELSGAVHVTSAQTVPQAFNAVETTISALTEEVLDNELVTAQSIIKLGAAAGTIDSNNNIEYVANSSANYISAATSLASADNILDSVIYNLSSQSSGSLSSITVNGINGTNTDKNASVVISGSDMNVGTYTSVEYPEKFSAATNVSGDQTVAEAFNAVETTISALTQEMILDELVANNSIIALANAAGTLDSNNNISYTPNTNANYINDASSLADADDMLDSAIYNLSNQASHAITGVSVNGVNGTVSNKVASVALSGENITLGTYTSVEYPEIFSSATNVSGSQTVSQAFNTVETTISALTTELLKDEMVMDKSIKALAEAAGTIDSNDDIKYVAPSSAKYISAATSVYDATVLLDTALQNNSGSISSITLNGTAATITNKVAALTASGSSINVGSYTAVTYPASLTGASNVSGSQTIAQAFNSVETTVSAVTAEVNKKADKVNVVNHGTGDTTFTLPPNEMHVWGSVSALTLSLATPTDNTIVNEYLFSFTSPLSATTLSLPASIKWVFTLEVEPEKTYTISIVDNLATYLTENMSIIGADESVLAQKEDISNKVTSINANSSDVQYPSAKCVYDYIEARLSQLTS